ncbi:hypothetical protein BD626DRAFT_565918 [Schizophyllum amplum]|uniref:Uncharacterized protein n=1 Tax=Schizophyllum amplum TaxID=97359 RepID=A0A550CPV6_9AGAR|nr:hypothetical protein BD626DRAFT_565918 [Auriculariopsis ampla]
MALYDIARSAGAAIGARVGAAHAHILILLVLSILALAAFTLRVRRTCIRIAQAARTLELEREAADLARALDAARAALLASEKEREFARVVRLVDEMRVACLQQRARYVEGRNAELEARAAAAKQEFVQLEERGAELLRRHTDAEHEKGVLGREAQRLSKAVDAYESLFFGEEGEEEVGAKERAPRSVVDTMCAAAPFLKRPSIEFLAPAARASLENVIALPPHCEEDDDLTLTMSSTCGSHMSFAPPSSTGSKASPSASQSSPSPPTSSQPAPKSSLSSLKADSFPAALRERTSSRGRLLSSASRARLSSMMGKKPKTVAEKEAKAAAGKEAKAVADKTGGKEAKLAGKAGGKDTKAAAGKETASTDKASDLKKKKSASSASKRIWRF